MIPLALFSLLTQQPPGPQTIPITALRTPYSMIQPTLYVGYGFGLNPVGRLEGLTLVNRQGVIVLRVVPLRIYNIPLVLNLETSTAPLPPKVSNPLLHLNGQRLFSPTDFTITGDLGSPQVVELKHRGLTSADVLLLDYDPLP